METQSKEWNGMARKKVVVLEFIVALIIMKGETTSKTRDRGFYDLFEAVCLAELRHSRKKTCLKEFHHVEKDWR